MSQRTCRYCKGELPEGAVKCRSCGEWIEGHAPRGGAEKVCLGLLVAELAAMAAMATHWIPTMRAMLSDLGTALPAFTRIVLGGWWMPVWIVIVLALAVGAMAAIQQPRRRATVLTSALALGLVVVVATWWALYLPIFDLASAIEP